MAETFVTKAGVEIPIKAINRYKIDGIFARMNKVKPPTYEVDLAGGGTETLEHNETTLTTDEERAAWKAYTDLLLKTQTGINKSFIDMLVLDGLVIDVPAGWEDEQKYLGIEIPENPFERKVHYVFTELLSDDEDFPNLFQAVLKLGRTNMEAAAEVAKGFRAGVEEAANREASQPQESLDGQERPAGGHAE